MSKCNFITLRFIQFIILLIICFKSNGQIDTIHVDSKFYLLNTPVENSLNVIKYDTIFQNKDTIVIEETYCNNILINKKTFNNEHQLIEETTFFSDSIYLKTVIKNNKIKLVHSAYYDRHIMFSWDKNNFSTGIEDRNRIINNGFLYDKDSMYDEDTITDAFSEFIDTTESGYLCKDFHKNARVFNFYYGLTKTSPFYKFHENGKLAMSGVIRGMEIFKIGSWKWWNDKGILIREFYYNDTIPNLKEGRWKWWDNNGKLIIQRDYLHGKLIKETIFVKDSEIMNNLKE